MRFEGFWYGSVCCYESGAVEFLIGGVIDAVDGDATVEVVGFYETATRNHRYR